MSLTSNQTIRCTECSFNGEAEIFSSINTSTSPELKEKVLDGSLFLWKCPQCGHTSLLKYPVLYHSPENKLMIWLTLCDSAVEEKAKSIFSLTEGLEDYTGRLVSDVGELIEKLKIFDAGLDDMVIELCKFVIRNEKPEIGGKTLRFLKMDGADAEMVFSYPGKSGMEMLGIGFNVYEDCRGILERNPGIKAGTEGLARIDSGWTDSVIR